MKKAIVRLVDAARMRARSKRAGMFRESLGVGPKTRILDIGSEDGSNIANVLKGTDINAGNVYIADINPHAIRRGHEKFGFVPVLIPESGRLPFDDKFFDIVYCSSVIEHVTVPKAQVWSLYDGREFRLLAWTRQQQFAREISRLGTSYFVQTPNRWFPIESHSWLPFASYLPRWMLVLILRFTNRVWIKQTAPDWSLLSTSEMRHLFPDAGILAERWAGLTKSIIAIERGPASVKPGLPSPLMKSSSM